MSKPTWFPSGLAVLASTQLAAAQSPQAPAAPCISHEEVRGLVAYLLPDFLNSTMTACGAMLPKGAYLNVAGPSRLAAFSAGKEAAWPMAMKAMTKMGGPDKAEMPKDVPDAAVRMIFDNTMHRKIGDAIAAKASPAMCHDINAVLAPLDPLPAANTVEFLAAVVDVVGRKEHPATCPAVLAEFTHP